MWTSPAEGMLSAEEEIAARLGAHEFLIELILALAFSIASPEFSAAAVRAAKLAAKTTHSAAGTDDDLARALFSSAMIGALLDKAVARTADIRALRAVS